MATGRINIELGALSISLAQDEMYPDAMSDMVARASILFSQLLAQAQAAGVDILAIYRPAFIHEDDEEFDDDE